MASLFIDDDGKGGVHVDAVQLRFQLPPEIDASADLEETLAPQQVLDAIRVSHPTLSRAKLSLLAEDACVEGWVATYPATGDVFVFVSTETISHALGQAIVRAAFDRSGAATLDRDSDTKLQITDFTSAPFHGGALTILALRPA